ncbi:MAG: OmpH family outer membrane protein [Sphingobacteriales bacterium]|jgi:outer membrane protein|nr:OmpH family outer membrane protein [Sphingobacteriales bacterium]
MKKLIVAAVMAFGVLSATAQNKIGYINTDELIGVMPEAEKADAELKEYQGSLQQQGQDLMKELNDKDSLFVRDSAKLSPSMKEIKKNELVALYQRVQNWNQQAQEMYQAEAQKKIAPLRNKALEAIRAVAKESGYSYILDVSAVIVGPPGDDVLALVKKKLGIKETPAATIPKKG